MAALSRTVGIAWYTPTTWRELRAIPEAKVKMSYSQYVRKVEQMIEGFAAEGICGVKTPIDVGQMVTWCRRHGYDVDSKGRAAFGVALTMALEAGKDVMTMPFEDRTRTVQ
jgi:hypothetical protein